MSGSIHIVSLQDFQAQQPDIYSLDPVRKVITQPEVCKADHYKDVLYGTFVIPEKKDTLLTRNVFSFCLTKEALYFIDEGSKIRKKVEKLESQYGQCCPSPLRFLLDMMEYLIREDLYRLENYEENLTAMENDLEKGEGKTTFTLTGLRQELNALSSYYMQLSDMGETIEQVILQTGNDPDRALISLYISRVKQLYNMTRYVKESLSQVLTLKQEKIGEKQNELINVLTIVTSIFTPLTLVTGWFGMNFENMPLLHKTWGYPVCILFCLVMLGVEITLICRMKVFRKQR